MTTKKIKRFYKQVAVQQDEAGAYQVTLDGRVLKTPQQQALHFETVEQANLVADEWRAQETFIDTDAMPLMRIHAIAIDRVPDDHALMLEDMLGYLHTDMLCYRAPAGSVICEKQAAMFDPVIKQFQQRFEVILRQTDGLMPINQPEDVQQKLRDLLQALPPVSFAAIALITPLLGSLILALAILHEDISAEDAWACARLDETVAAEQYGADPMLEASLDAKARDVLAAGKLLKLVAADMSERVS